MKMIMMIITLMMIMMMMMVHGPDRMVVVVLLEWLYARYYPGCCTRYYLCFFTIVGTKNKI